MVDFDTLAAIEVAAMTREAIRAGDKKAGSQAVWQKVKMDRQIIAIGRVMNVKTIYSDDTGVGTFAAMLGIPVVRTWEMPLPPQDAQAGLFDAVNEDEELLAEADATTAEGSSPL
ncbi:hypothetical protein CSW58_08955 [Caulobacter sp. B11]|nr:hypothetical protein CSW58_08955 [Caulobacter sp. B11]